MRAAMLGLVLMATFTTAAPLQTSRTRGAEQGPSLDPPGQVSVFPLFLVPAGAAAPTGEQKQTLERHLQICRSLYAEMLGTREGFRVAPGSRGSSARTSLSPSSTLCPKIQRPRSWRRCWPNIRSTDLHARIFSSPS